MAAHWPGEDLRAGMATAQSAYGDAVRRELDAVLSSMNDADYRQRCLDALSVSDTDVLSRGLRALRQL